MTSPSAIFDRPSVWRAREILRSGLAGVDRMIAASPGPGFPLTLERVVTLTHLASDQQVVDIGSGLGGATSWLAEAAGAEVSAIEPMRASRQASRLLFPTLKVTAASLESATATHGGSADVVTALGVVSLTPSPEHAVGQLVEIARPMGYVAVVDLLATRDAFHSGRDMFVTADMLAAFFEKAEAEIVCVEPTPPTPSRWSALDDCITAAMAARHRGEGPFEDWMRDRQVLNELQEAGVIWPAVVIAVRRT